MARRTELTCDHDHLLHNRLGDPQRPATLHAEFCRTFCKIFDGKILHDAGLDRPSGNAVRVRPCFSTVHGLAESWAGRQQKLRPDHAHAQERGRGLAERGGDSVREAGVSGPRRVSAI